MFWETLLKPVSDIINKTLDKVAGDKISELDKARIAIETQRLVSETLQKEEDNFRNFVIRYEGEAKDMPKFIQVLRGSVRPVLTYFLAGSWIWGYVYIFTSTGIDMQKMGVMDEVMGLLFKLNLLSLGFWYGEKLITRTGLSTIFKSKNGNEKKNEKEA